MTPEAAIETRDLTKYYGRNVGIEDLTLRVEPGEMFGFLGPNGAGKTTTLRVLMGFLRATSGTARVLGRHPWKGHAARARVGYMPGEVRLNGYERGTKLLRFLERITPGTDRSHRERLLERLDLDPGRRYRTLSHGMKRKLLLVQAMAHRPKLLVLDEPTQGLDPLVRNEVHELLKEARDEGATVFLSSHDLSEVERICDRVAIIRRGHLILTETVEAILARTDKAVEIWLEGDANLPAIEGLTVLDRSGNRWQCRYRGAMPALLGALARVAIRDLSIHAPDLEDLFLELYGEESTTDYIPSGNP